MKGDRVFCLPEDGLGSQSGSDGHGAPAIAGKAEQGIILQKKD